MREILVDYGRKRGARKRGGGLRVVELDDAIAPTDTPAPDLLALHEALERLSLFDPRKAQVVAMRIFGGMSREETAEALNLSTDTVTRDMQLATAWLRRDLDPE